MNKLGIEITVSMFDRLLVHAKFALALLVFVSLSGLAADPVHRRDIKRRWVEWIADHFQTVIP